MTENHGYNTPAQGATDWHIPLNTNFTDIDTDVEVRDVESAISNYIPKDGAKFVATDTGGVWIGDGTQWNFLGDIVPEQTGGSALGVSPIDFQPSPTDGILEAIRSRDGPVRVNIPRGGGSGPNGEYVIAETEPNDVYADTDSGPGVKIDRSDVWIVSDGATVTVDPDAPCHVFFPAAFTDDNNGPLPGTQVSNIHIRGLIFDGKGRDGIAYSTYESENTSIKHCVFTNWAPSTTQFFDSVPVRAQHHGDTWTWEKNVFACNTPASLVAYAKWDGTWGGNLKNNWFYVPDNATGAPARYAVQKINNDHNRPSVGNVVEDNLFDYRYGRSLRGPQVHILQSMGDRICNNTWAVPIGQSDRLKLKFTTVQNNSARGSTIRDNTFIGTSMQILNLTVPARGLIIEGNDCINTSGNDFMALIEIESGIIDGARIENNTYINASESDIGSAPDSGALIRTTTDFNNVSIINNKTWDADQFIDDASGGAWSPGGNYWRNNDSPGSPAVTSPPKQRNKGTATIPSGSSFVSVQHGLAMTPLQDDVSLTYMGPPSGGGPLYVTNIDATSFDLNSENAPTADVTVSWQADATPDWAM